MPEDENTEVQETDSPWASDVEAAFEDEDVRRAVSDFLGEKVQPYVTKVEQEARPSRDATRLWEGYEERPVETSIQVVKEIFGDEIGDRFAELLQGGASPEEAAKQVEAETDVDVSSAEGEEPAEQEGAKSQVAFEQLPPEVQDAVAQQQQEKQKEAYYAEIDRVKTEHASDLPQEGEGDDAKPVIDVDLFHPFVVAANGDFDAAIGAYLKFIGQAKETFGIKVPDTDEVPPPTINSETKDAGATPPTSKEHQSLDEALDEFFEEQKAPPATVGGV